MNNLNGGAESVAAVGCSAWLACVCIGCFVFIGLPIGCLLGSWLALRNGLRNTPGQTVRPSVDHVAELLKHRPPFVVYLSANLCVFYRLLFQKGKLLLQKALLKSVGNPTADQNAKHGGTDSGKEGFVCHNGVATQANDALCRPADSEAEAQKGQSK